MARVESPYQPGSAYWEESQNSESGHNTDWAGKNAALEQRIAYLEQRIAQLEKEQAEAKETLAQFELQIAVWDRIFSECYWGMAVSDAEEETLLWANSYYADMHGYMPYEIERKSVFNALAPECRERIPEIIGKVQEQGHYTYNATHIRKDGSRFPAHVETFEVLAGDLRLRVDAVWDESERKLKAHEDEHKRLYALFDSFPGIIVIQEDGYNIRYANNGFRRVFGDFEGKLCYQVMAGQDQPCQGCATVGVYRSGKPLREERGFVDRVFENYIYPFVDVDGSRLVVKILMDITERKNSERELARLDRLNMVGEMAAGIAHEVRNPMTAVRGFLQILGSKLDTQHYKEFFEIMIGELDRANQIISEFLSLTRDKPADFESTNVSEIVHSLYPLLAADALNQDKSVRIEVGRVANIHGNEKELRQLIVNLARNGLEAMSTGQELTICTYMENRSIVLEIKDQGPGFAPLVLERLGTPFLTTKEKGTGLGIVICQSIVARHKATMDFESNARGTTVKVVFPVE